MRPTYYNEFDPHAAAWLRELIREGLIPPGEVDERSIKDVQADDVRGFGRAHFFAGIGGWELALRLAGWPADRPVWTGSCPCQPFSSTGKGEAQNDPRHLWPDFFRLVRECRPDVVFGEQVEGAIRKGWLDGVCGDLEGEGYAVGSVVLGAHSVGAPHIRQRLYWSAARAVGLADGAGCGRGQGRADGRGGDPRGDAHVRPGPEHGRGAGELADASSAAGDPASDGRPLDERRPRAGNEPVAADSGGACGAYGIAADAHDGRPSAADASTVGFWDAFALVACRDGKARRVEPGSFPLAHGFPRELGPLLAVLGRMGVDPGLAKRAIRNARSRLARAGRNRVGRLKGYGNAIVPEVAAEFVAAFLAVEAERRVA